MVSSQPRARTVPASVSFGDLLKQHRRAAGLTQEMLADRAGYSTVYISMLERGRRQPFSATIEALADALALSPPERAAFHLVASAGEAAERSAIVGRQREIDRLDRHIAGEGRPLLMLAGEPGIGKSCLLRETAARAGLRGMTVLAGGCTRRGGQEPYAPLLDAVQAHIGGRTQEELRGNLAGCAWLVRLLPELRDGPIEPLPGWTLSPAQEQRLMTNALLRFLANIAGPAGTLLVLDDLHWAGSDALDLLAVLARAADVPLRIIGAYRDTEAHRQHPLSMLLADLAQASLVAQLNLAPLPPEDAQELLDRLLAEETVDEATREQTIERTGGVPFFVISCAQALRADGVTGAGHLPWDLTQSVRQRLAALPESTQDVLAAAATIGRQVESQILAETIDRTEDEILRALEAARHARLLEEDGSEYRFVHDIVREVAEHDLGPGRRAVIHRRIADALERRPGPPPLERLAYHYARGNDRAKAILYLERAGDNATARYANAAAEGYYRELADRLGAHGQSPALARAEEKLGVVLGRSARYDEALSSLRRAAAICQSADDIPWLRQVAAEIGRIHAQQGTTEEGLRYLAPFVEVLPADHVSAEAVAMFNAMARLLFVSGRYEQQLAITERAVAMSVALGDERVLVIAESMRAAALGMVGRIPESLEVGERVMALAERLGDLDTLRRACNNIGATYLESGALERSRPYIEKALRASRQTGDPTLIGFTVATLAELDYLTGNWEQARRACEEAAALSDSVHSSSLAGLASLNIAQLSVPIGDWDTVVQRMEALLARVSEMQTVRSANRYLAMHDLHTGRPERALARIEPLLDRPGMEEWDVTRFLPLLARAHLALGDVRRAEEVAASAVRRAGEAGYGLALLEALRVHATVLIELQQMPQAETLLTEALERARAMPHPYEEAQVLQLQGMRAAAMNADGRARDRLGEALVIYRRLGATPAIEEVEEALHALES